MAAKPITSYPAVALTLGVFVWLILNPSGFGSRLVSTVVYAKLGSSFETSVVATNVFVFCFIEWPYVPEIMLTYELDRILCVPTPTNGHHNVYGCLQDVVHTP